jgi:hypothetical protein
VSRTVKYFTTLLLGHQYSKHFDFGIANLVLFELQIKRFNTLFMLVTATRQQINISLTCVTVLFGQKIIVIIEENRSSKVFFFGDEFLAHKSGNRCNKVDLFMRVRKRFRGKA